MSINEKLTEAVAHCARLRRNFDSGFAVPAANGAELMEDLLAIGVGGDSYALRLSEIAGLQVDLTVVPIPSPAPHLLGLAAIRGLLTPIYDLAGLLGYSQASNARWIVLARAPYSVGLALEKFDAHLRVRAAVLTEELPQEGSRTSRLARGAVTVAGALRPILQIAPLMQLIREKTHAG